jgi:hypothetical protein
MQEVEFLMIFVARVTTASSLVTARAWFSGSIRETSTGSTGFVKHLFASSAPSVSSVSEKQ